MGKAAVWRLPAGAAMSCMWLLLLESLLGHALSRDTRTIPLARKIAFHNELRPKGLVHNRQLFEDDVNKKMWKAAKMGNAEEVKGHLMAGGDINYRMEPYGDTPLTISASYGHLEVVEQLLTAGADVNMTDTTYHATPLFWAAYGGHVNIVVALIKAGANVEQSDINAVTPLEIAAERGHAGVVEALLVAGADPNRLDLLGDTPLHVASVTLGPASERIVNDLLDAGANIDAQSLDGGTPLMWSVMFGNANTTRVLLLRGADASVEDGMGRRAEDLICQCKLSRGLDHLLQCPPGGCDKKSTVKAIKKYLETL